MPMSKTGANGGLTLLIGGARSGKSTLAVDMGKRHKGDVVFIATAPHIDADMTQRIQRHRAERPPWPTIEEEIDVRSALRQTPDDACVIIDCLTLWVSNMLHCFETESDSSFFERAETTAEVAAARSGATIAITNEVGLGIHPETPLGRRYRDVLGGVNQIWVRHASQTMLLVAGKALTLHDPWEILT